MPRVKEKTRNRKIKQAKPKARKPLRSKRSGSWRKVAAVLAFVVVASTVGAAGGFCARQLYVLFTSSQTFAVHNIEVLGTTRVGRNEILDRSGISEGANIFSVDIDEAARLIQSHPWIKGVTVKRYFPDRILIHIVERTAAAIIRLDKLMLIDGDFEIFKALEAGDPRDFPIITVRRGSENAIDPVAMKRALRLIESARSSSIVNDSNISEIILTDHGMEIVLIGPPYSIKMGYELADENWSKLETVLADAQRNGEEVVGVDLRYREGAALRVKSSPQTLVADGRRATTTTEEKD